MSLTFRIFRRQAAIAVLTLALACSGWSAHAAQSRQIVLAGGCFWGMEAVYDHVKGVEDVVSGYSGGAADTATYAKVSRGQTDHAEAVKITYDPEVVDLSQLLDVYFTVAHNPTQLDYQGPDHGPQYRSAIFYADDTQKQQATDKIESVTAAKIYDDPIVTRLEALTDFYVAEDKHQDFAVRHPNHPYIVAHDKPKVASLEKEFPALYQEK